MEKNLINRDQPSLNILKNIKSILNERYQESYTIDRLINILSYKLTSDKNKENVEIFRRFIIDNIPLICDAVDSFNFKEMYDISSSILNDIPSTFDKSLKYSLQKIFSNLNENDSENEEENRFRIGYGMDQLENFYQKFAIKWVQIDIEKMDFDELKLLITTACYMELSNERKSND